VKVTAAIRSASSRVLGGEIDHSARPLIVTVLIGSMARSVMISFTGIWAIRQLVATDRELGLAYAAAGVTAALTGFAAGLLADRMGGRRVLLVGWLMQAGAFASFAAAGRNVPFGLFLIVFTTSLATLCATAGQTLVTTLVPAERHTSGFASIRLGQNLGYAAGPPIGALLLSLGWRAMFLSVSALAAVAAATVLVKIPGKVNATATRRAGERVPVLGIVRDTIYLRIYVASCFAMIIYSAEAVLLPVSLVESHGISTRTWGILAVINPVLVIALQLRVTERLRRVPLSLQATAAVLLMGGPFVLLPVSTAVTVVAITLVLYTLGEVIWAPAAQSLVAGLAPPGRQGAYLGAFAATLPIGLAVGPLIDFQIRAAWGDTAMWVINGAIAVVAAAVYAWAATAKSPAEDPRLMRAARRAAPQGTEPEVAAATPGLSEVPAEHASAR
jgi:predicted MFS family arabinose efflux permease